VSDGLTGYRGQGGSGKRFEGYRLGVGSFCGRSLWSRSGCSRWCMACPSEGSEKDKILRIKAQYFKWSGLCQAKSGAWSRRCRYLFIFGALRMHFSSSAFFPSLKSAISARLDRQSWVVILIPYPNCSK